MSESVIVPASSGSVPLSASTTELLSDLISKLHVPCSAMPVSVPLIQVPIEQSPQKAKEKVSGKRKLGDTSDVVIVGEKRKGKKPMTTPTPRITRSKSAFGSVDVVANVSPIIDPASPPASIKIEKFKPILRVSSLIRVWTTHNSRGVLLQKEIDVDDIMRNCNIIPLLKDQDLLQTVQKSEIEEPYEPALDFLASALTHAQLTKWPQGDIQSNLLTTVYSVLFRFASHNWMPNASHLRWPI